MLHCGKSMLEEEERSAKAVNGFLGMSEYIRESSNRDQGAVATKFDEPDTAQPMVGRRGAARARLQANASLETTTGKVPVIVRNLSCSGAMIEGSNLPALNRTALLKRGRIEALGTVVWQEGGRCGFQFYDDLPHDAVVAEARKPPEPPRRPAPTYWSPSGMADVVSVDDWQKAKARAEREYRGLRGFS